MKNAIATLVGPIHGPTFGIFLTRRNIWQEDLLLYTTWHFLYNYLTRCELRLTRTVLQNSEKSSREVLKIIIQSKSTRHFDERRVRRNLSFMRFLEVT